MHSSEDQVIRRLRARRGELQDDLDRLTRPPIEGSNLGFGKRVGDGTTEAVERIASTATARSLARSLSEIDAAIDRLERGLYGRCAKCGDEIPPDRLEARPATIYCVACASS